MDINKFYYIMLYTTFSILFVSLYYTLESLNLKIKFERSSNKEYMFKSEKYLSISRFFLIIGTALVFAWFYLKII